MQLLRSPCDQASFKNGMCGLAAVGGWSEKGAALPYPRLMNPPSVCEGRWYKLPTRHRMCDRCGVWHAHRVFGGSSKGSTLYLLSWRWPLVVVCSANEAFMRYKTCQEPFALPSSLSTAGPQNHSPPPVRLTVASVTSSTLLLTLSGK
jgi:hypothetical protein